jgi:hypothetical protein
LTVRRLFAVAFIFGCTALAWFALGASVVHRTGSSDYALSQAVTDLWGGAHGQAAPTVSHQLPRQVTEEVIETEEEGRVTKRQVEKTIRETISIPLVSSRVRADLALEHRRKGLLWYDTYTVKFRGNYRFRAPEDVAGPVKVAFTFPSSDSVYDDFFFRVDGQEAPPADQLDHGVWILTELEPGAKADVEVGYTSRGLDTWNYYFAVGGVSTVRDFELTMTTDFRDFDFPPGTLSPTAKVQRDQGWKLAWRFDNLVSGKHIGVDLPNRLNPGPLTARITFFAPVSLLFFVTVLVMLGALKHINLQPMHYFFLSAAFFAFHLLLAYLVDHLDINIAFVLASFVSITLVVSYLRLVCGLRRALFYAGGAQLVFLVLFSYAFFFAGYTGLTVTIGAVLTLFVLMQLTGRIDWEGIFARGTDAIPRPLENPTETTS